MMIEILPAVPAHIRALANNLRPADLAEVSYFGISPIKALWLSYRASTYCQAALVDSEVAAVWGLAGTVLSTEASVWLLTSPTIERISLTFIKSARAEIRKMLTFYSRLYGQTDRNYTRALRFLEALGFTIENSDSQILQFSMDR